MFSTQSQSRILPCLIYYYPTFSGGSEIDLIKDNQRVAFLTRNGAYCELEGEKGKLNAVAQIAGAYPSFRSPGGGGGYSP